MTATDAAGNITNGTINITVTVDQAPTAGNTIVRNDNPSSTSNAINVVASASDPDKDHLTVTISTPANVGTATVNSDSTVRISGLPGDFKGVIHFGYTVTDPSSKTATAGAAVFVGVDPFRITFVADSDPKGSGQYEVYLTNFAGAPVKETAATQGNARLQGYAVSNNGATIVYRSLDPQTLQATAWRSSRLPPPLRQFPSPCPVAPCQPPTPTAMISSLSAPTASRLRSLRKPRPTPPCTW